ncbi:MAG: TetR/AcrR family transcriptional regulator [Anaerolineae bacterium]|nr:TetR/AcrR family transcriptional regulator [Anaerolineae bacterium]
MRQVVDPTGNRFERRKQRTRALLRQAAIDIMLERGYDAVTVQDIVNRADVGRGTFYIHFKDKEDLLWSVIDEQLNDLHRQIQQIALDRPFEERVYFIWLLNFQYVADNRRLIHMALGPKGHGPLAYRVYFRMAGMMLTDLPSFAPRMPFKLPFEFMANYLIGAQMQITVWWLDHMDDYSAQDIARMFYQMTTGRAPDFSTSL